MRGPVLALALLAFVAVEAPRPAAAQSMKPAEPAPDQRTPWGDPDLQGLWNHGTTTPLDGARSRAAADEGFASGAGLLSAIGPSSLRQWEIAVS